MKKTWLLALAIILAGSMCLAENAKDKRRIIYNNDGEGPVFPVVFLNLL